MIVFNYSLGTSLIDCMSTSSKQMSDLSNLRKQRGTIKASITKLHSRLKSLESRADEVSTLDLANQVVPNLKKALDEQFKAQHFLSVDAINETDETSLTREQDIFWINTTIISL